MLPRIFLLTLLLVSALGQDSAPENKDSQSQPETLSLEDRPRGERAEDELPPPRRQRHGCHPTEMLNFSPFLFSSQLKRN